MALEPPTVLYASPMTRTWLYKSAKLLDAHTPYSVVVATVLVEVVMVVVVLNKKIASAALRNVMCEKPYDIRNDSRCWSRRYGTCYGLRRTFARSPFLAGHSVNVRLIFEAW